MNQPVSNGPKPGARNSFSTGIVLGQSSGRLSCAVEAVDKNVDKYVDKMRNF